MLALLAHGVATYRDCPDEAASLQQVCVGHLAMFKYIGASDQALLSDVSPGTAV